MALQRRWSVKKRFDSPEVRVNAQYGEHAFAIQTDYLNDHLRDIGPPDVTYSYVTIGVARCSRCSRRKVT